VEELVRIIREPISYYVVGLSKFSTPMENWYHLELDKFNEEEEQLIILISETEIQLGWRYKEVEKPNFYERDFRHFTDLTYEDILYIRDSIQKEIEKIFKEEETSNNVVFLDVIKNGRLK